MRIDAQSEKALQQPDTRVRTVEMTPKVRAKFARVSGLVIDLLRQHTDGPHEAYMVLQVIREAFEEKFGIRGAIIVPKDSKES